jgi:hypothetical protein
MFVVTLEAPEEILTAGLKSLPFIVSSISPFATIIKEKTVLGSKEIVEVVSFGVSEPSIMNLRDSPAFPIFVIQSVLVNGYITGVPAAIIVLWVSFIQISYNS